MPSQIPVQPPHLSPGKRAVLAALVEFPEATVITIADAAQVGRSSAAAALNMLEQYGLAVRRPSTLCEATHRPADLWCATPAAAPSLAATPQEPKLGSGAIVEAPMQDVTDEEVIHQPAAEVVSDNVSRPDANETAALSGSTNRLGKGMLREAVRQHLLAHPEAVFTPTALSRALGRSGGAISNALDALVADGEASMVLEKPRTFCTKLAA